MHAFRWMHSPGMEDKEGAQVSCSIKTSSLTESGARLCRQKFLSCQ